MNGPVGGSLPGGPSSPVSGSRRTRHAAPSVLCLGFPEPHEQAGPDERFQSISARSLESNMKELARVRTRWVSNPRYLNVDFDRTEVGYLVLSGDGEVAEAVSPTGWR